MKDILVSIITPCLNSKKTIRKTIESVINQTYKNIEYIIVDGESTDGTIEIINEYREKYKDRIKFISEKDHGIYDAMNKGIKLCSGSLIGIINSDDYYETNAVEIMVESMNESTYQILYGIVRVLKNETEYALSMNNHNFLNELMIPHPTCFITKKIYEDFGAYNLKYKLASDYDLMLRSFRNKKISFISVGDIISNYSLGGASESYLTEVEYNKIRKGYGIYNNLIYICYLTKIYIIHCFKTLFSKWL